MADELSQRPRRDFVPAGEELTDDEKAFLSRGTDSVEYSPGTESDVAAGFDEATEVHDEAPGVREDITGDPSELREAAVEAAEPDPAEGTKDELLERARELDIEGRSTMNKAELAEAVAEAEKSEDTDA